MCVCVCVSLCVCVCVCVCSGVTLGSADGRLRLLWGFLIALGIELDKEVHKGQNLQ